MNRLNIAVIRGGVSSEHLVSLKTGWSFLSNLDPEKYNIIDIIIDKNGLWYKNLKLVSIKSALFGVDMVINGLHGYFGEDGKLQDILERFNIPFSGSRSLSSALSMNKKSSKDIYNKFNIKTAYFITLDRDNFSDYLVKDIFSNFPIPAIVKPVSAGSSVGINIARDFNSLKNAINKAFLEDDQIMIEEFINGREATCGVIDNFREKDVYSLLPVEIVPPKENQFFDLKCKYDGSTQELCPGNFSPQESRDIQYMAILAHQALGLKHYSRSDFIISKRGVYILETNTLPGMTRQSLFPKSLQAVGSDISEFLNHIIEIEIK